MAEWLGVGKMSKADFAGSLSWNNQSFILAGIKKISSWRGGQRRAGLAKVWVVTAALFAIPFLFILTGSPERRRATGC